MNNNLLLLPGRAINTQLANARRGAASPHAAIRLVTHRHDICFPRVECTGYYECHLPTADIGSIVARCVSWLLLRRFRQSRPLRHRFGPVDIPPRRVPSLLISLLTETPPHPSRRAAALITEHCIVELVHDTIHRVLKFVSCFISSIFPFHSCDVYAKYSTLIIFVYMRIDLERLYR